MAQRRPPLSAASTPHRTRGEANSDAGVGYAALLNQGTLTPRRVPPPSPRLQGARSRGDTQIQQPSNVSWARTVLGSVPFLARWINYLCGGYLGWTPLTVENLFDDLRNGLVLCRMVESLVPGADLSRGLYLRPRTRSSCLSNIEKALTAVWRRSPNPANMCSAEDVYEGRQAFVARGLLEVFEALQMRLREVRKQARELLRRMHATLAQMGRPLSEQTLADPLGFCNQLLGDFADGTRVMALLVAGGYANLEDLLRLRDAPHCEQESHWVENAEYVGRALAAAGCPVLLSPHEWRSPPAPFPDTLLFQLHVLGLFLFSRDEAALEEHGHMFRLSKAAAVAQFQGFLSQHFNRLEDAFSVLCQNQSWRLSRQNFLRALRQFGFEGDAKFIWDCIEHSSDGYVGLEEFRQLVPSLGAPLTGPLALAGEAGVETEEDLDAQEARLERELGFGEESSPGPGPGEERGEQLDDLPIATPHETQEDSEGAQTKATLELTATPHTPTPVRLVEFRQGLSSSGLRSAAEREKDLARFRSAAEERSSLLDEDIRRQLELYELGSVTQARRVAAAAAAGAAAAGEVAEEAEVLADLPTGSFESLLQESEDGSLEELLNSAPAPTASLAARAVLSDGSYRRVWLMTAVVSAQGEDGRGTEDSDGADSLCVLEVRERNEDVPDTASAATGKLCAQVDLANVLAVEQRGPALRATSPTASVPFHVLAIAGADLLLEDVAGELALTTRSPRDRRRPSELRRQVLREVSRKRDVTVFHVADEANGQPLRMLKFVAGGSPWSRREALRFFDELRILVHFLSPGAMRLAEEAEAQARMQAGALLAAAEAAALAERVAAAEAAALEAKAAQDRRLAAASPAAASGSIPPQRPRGEQQAIPDDFLVTATSTATLTLASVSEGAEETAVEEAAYSEEEAADKNPQDEHEEDLGLGLGLAPALAQGPQQVTKPPSAAGESSAQLGSPAQLASTESSAAPAVVTKPPSAAGESSAQLGSPAQLASTESSAAPAVADEVGLASAPEPAADIAPPAATAVDEKEDLPDELGLALPLPASPLASTSAPKESLQAADQPAAASTTPSRRGSQEGVTEEAGGSTAGAELAAVLARRRRVSDVGSTAAKIREREDADLEAELGLSPEVGLPGPPGPLDPGSPAAATTTTTGAEAEAQAEAEAEAEAGKGTGTGTGAGAQAGAGPAAGDAVEAAAAVGVVEPVVATEAEAGEAAQPGVAVAGAGAGATGTGTGTGTSTEAGTGARDGAAVDAVAAGAAGAAGEAGDAGDAALEAELGLSPEIGLPDAGQPAPAPAPAPGPSPAPADAELEAELGLGLGIASASAPGPSPAPADAELEAELGLGPPAGPATASPTEAELEAELGLSAEVGPPEGQPPPASAPAAEKASPGAEAAQGKEDSGEAAGNAGLAEDLEESF